MPDYLHTVPASATCMVCGTTFGSRLGLIVHLSVKRRAKCWHAMLQEPAKYPRLSGKVCAKLDAKDRAERTAAQRVGHSHVLSKGGCTRREGTAVGRPSS